MSGNSVQNLGILIEARTSGEQAVKNLEDRVNSLFKRLEDSGAAEVLRRGLQAAEAAFITGAAAAIKHRTVIENTVDTYRGARLALAALEGSSRLYFAGATVGAGILVEKLLSVAGGYSKVLEQQAQAAAAAQKSITDIERAANVRRITGNDFGPAANFSAEQLRTGIDELRKIPDAFGRAQRAQALFGADGQEVLNKLQSRIVQNVQAAEDLSTSLGQDARASIQRLRDDIDAFKNFNPFGGALEGLRTLRAEAAQGITVTVAAVVDDGRGLLRTVAGGFAGDSAGGEGGPGLAAERGLGLDEIKRQLRESIGAVVSGANRAPAAPAEAFRFRGTAADVARANAILGGSTDSLEGARRGLEQANREYQEALRKYDINRGGENEALDLRVAAEERAKWQRRAKIYEEANDAAQRAKEIRRTLIQQIAGFESERLPPELRIAANREAQANQIREQAVLTQDIKNLLESSAFAQLSNLSAAAAESFPLGRPQTLNQQIPDRLAGVDAALRAVLNAGQFDTAQSNLQSLFPLAGTSATNTAGLIGPLGRGFAQQFELDRQRSVDEVRRVSEFQSRALQALAKPGDEVSTINRLAEIRITAAEREAEIFRDTAREREALAALEARTDEARLQRAVDLLNIDKQRREQFRNAVGSLFDAGVAGGEGIQSFFTSIVRSNARIAAQNSGELLFSKVAGKIALPGQVGADDKPTTLGRILSGTIFQRNPLEGQLDLNTIATRQNTEAMGKWLQSWSAVAAVGGGNATADLSSTSPFRGLTIPGGVPGASLLSSFLGASDTISAIRNSRVRDPFGGRVPDSVRASAQSDFYRDVLGIDTGVQTAAKAGSSNLAKGLGVVASLGAAGFGIAAGVREGGLRGATTATASGLGGLASILTLAGVSGPAAPIVAGAALGLTYARLLFPDPKKQREDFINSQLDAARYNAPAATSYGVGLDGGGVDTNKAGALRPIIVNISALDVKSFMDRKNEFADVLRYAMQEGHAINGEIREAMGL